VALSSLLFKSGDTPASYLLIVSLAYLPQSFEILDVWFQKNIQSKFTVIAKTFATTGAAILRVTLVYYAAPIWTFCAAMVAEATLFAAGLIVVALRNGIDPSAWRFSAPIARGLLSNGWPLILAGILVAIYQRVEIFLVKDWLGVASLGVYNAAGKITELWSVLPGLLLPTLYPLMAQKKEDDPLEYKRRVQTVFDILTGCGFLIAIFATLTAPWVIQIIYGKAFAAAAGILMIQAWTAPFTLSGAVRGQFFVLENLTVYHWVSAALGIAANIVATMLLIPRMGAAGAAVGSLIGYIVSAFLSSWMFGRLRSCALYQTRAMLILFRIPTAVAEVRRFL
jgi:PST family polysaccharide transporter